MGDDIGLDMDSGVADADVVEEETDEAASADVAEADGDDLELTTAALGMTDEASEEGRPIWIWETTLIWTWIAA